MDILYIVMPAYNESDTIETVARQWHEVAVTHGAQSRLVVVNDGSRDDTGSKLAALQKQLPALLPLEKPNGGHGSACLYGYRYALNCGADYIFQTDSDGQTLPAEFEAFWQKRSAYDMVIGHRAHRQDGFSRRMVTKVLKYTTRLLLHARTTDPNTPYRLMQRDFLTECMTLIPPDFNLPNVLIAAFGARLNKKVLYLPITFLPRQGGKNSINLPRIVRIGRKAIGDFARINRSLSQRSR